MATAKLNTAILLTESSRAPLGVRGALRSGPKWTKLYQLGGCCLDLSLCDEPLRLEGELIPRQGAAFGGATLSLYRADVPEAVTTLALDTCGFSLLVEPGVFALRLELGDEAYTAAELVC